MFLAVAVGISASVVTTRQGVNFKVSTREIPLYIKVSDFFHRHYQYRMLAREITQGLGSDPERALAVFEWTRRNIRRTPEGWPVADDHVLNIIIRGYGLNDQMADVFTTLSTYVGVPAFWRVQWFSTGQKSILSFARVEGRWVVFDVENGLAFRNKQGALASVQEIAADPCLVKLAAESVSCFAGFVPPRVPDVIRAEQQMPWPRLVYEVRQSIGVAPKENASP